MFDILMDLGKSALGEIIGSSGKKGGGGQMYDPASSKKLAFAAERQAAMTASRDATNLSSNRSRNEKENSKEKSKYAQEVAQLLRSIQDTKVREALIKQMASAGKIDHSSLAKYRTSSSTVDDTATTKKPVGFA